MDAAGKQERLNARFIMLVFDLVKFRQTLPLCTPSPYDGIECPPNGFLLQCQLYHHYLVEPKPMGWTWMRFMLSRLTGSACKWGECLVVSQQLCLYIVMQFSLVLKLVLPLFRHQDPLEIFFGGAEASVDEPESDRAASAPELPPVVDKATNREAITPELPPEAGREGFTS